MSDARCTRCGGIELYHYCKTCYGKPTDKAEKLAEALNKIYELEDNLAIKTSFDVKIINIAKQALDEYRRVK